MIFDNAQYPTNISYDGSYWSLKPGEYIIMQHLMRKKPDQVTYSYDSQPSNQNLQGIESITPLTNSSPSGSWYWNNKTDTLSYIIANNYTQPILDVPISFAAYVCKYADCIYPISPALKPPVTSRPANALFWSALSTWTQVGLNGGSTYFYPNGSLRFPQDGDQILIPTSLYVVVDTQLPKFTFLQLDGILELDNGINHDLECEILFINGGQLIVGWENNPILTNVTISLTGTKAQSSPFLLPDALNMIPFKSIGVYGGKDEEEENI